MAKMSLNGKNGNHRRTPKLPSSSLFPELWMCCSSSSNLTALPIALAIQISTILPIFAIPMVQIQLLYLLLQQCKFYCSTHYSSNANSTALPTASATQIQLLYPLLQQRKFNHFIYCYSDASSTALFTASTNFFSNSNFNPSTPLLQQCKFNCSTHCFHLCFSNPNFNHPTHYFSNLLLYLLLQ